MHLLHTSPQATCESNAAGNELVSSPSLIGIKQQFLKTVFVVGKRVFRPNGGREDKYTLFWFFKTQLFCLEHRCKKVCQQIKPITNKSGKLPALPAQTAQITSKLSAG